MKTEHSHNQYKLAMSKAQELSQGELAGNLILQMAGEDITREGIVNTPKRFSKAMGFLLQGYQQNPFDAVGQGVFAAEGKGLVSVNNIEFYSMCEHHILPFWGTATVAYYPSDKILGLSKFPRVLEIFARRLQVQERLTRQVAESIVGLISPRAVMVRMKASHLCMMMRGVEKQHSFTVTEFGVGVEKLPSIDLQRMMAVFND